MIPALHELWGGGLVEHHGEHYDFGPLSITPVPSAKIPVYIGGDSDVALKRAAKIGDGWIGNRVYREDELETLMVRLEGFLKDNGRTLDDLKVIAPIGAWPSADLYRKWHDRGVDGTMAAPWWMASAEEKALHGDGIDLKIATMERFAEEIISQL
jgi:hypothetical protein